MWNGQERAKDNKTIRCLSILTFLNTSNYRRIVRGRTCQGGAGEQRLRRFEVFGTNGYLRRGRFGPNEGDGGRKRKLLQ